jgi:hypothetical protein
MVLPLDWVNLYLIGATSFVIADPEASADSVIKSLDGSGEAEYAKTTL